MKENFFRVHHVGGRNGSRGFPLMPNLERDIVTVFYEASEDGNEQILAQARRNKMENTVLVNACVGKSGETKKFYLNRDPFMSSTFPANPNFSHFYQDLSSYDNIFGQILEPIETSEVRVQSLDELIKERGLPACDFLSVDVQGGELDILMGAIESLEDAVGVVVEVEFAEVYKGQPLFSDVNNFMIENGFSFIRFLGLQEWAPSKTPIAGRGNKMHFAADALYLRNSDTLKAKNLERLLFASLAFGQTEYAASIQRNLPSLALEASGNSVSIFVKKFFQLLESNKNMQPTFNDFYSVEESFGRFLESFEPSPRKNLFLQGMLQTWRKIPKRFRAKIHRVLQKFFRIFKWCKFKLGGTSSLEKLFLDVGLNQVAQTLKRSRLR